MFTAQKVRKTLALIAVSVSCFLVAAFVITRFFYSDAQEFAESDNSDSAKNSREKIFPDSIQIGREGRYLEVQNSPGLLPEHKKDYLLFFWFNLKSLPAVGERLVLLSKYNGAPPKIKGFAVGISRDSSAIRPVLFWGDGTTAGRWHDFPEIPLISNEWNLLAIHVHKDRFVGMYSARIVAGKASPVKFLGGHEIVLEDPLNLGDASILFGSPEGRDFRGKIGPLAIISPLSIDFEELDKALEAYVESPLDFSKLGAKSDYQLKIREGRKDSSKSENKVVTTY